MQAERDMDKQNKEIEINEPRMVKSHDVKLDTEYAEVTNLLLDMGTGFAFMGRQKEIIVGGRSRKIDLLF